HRRSRPPKGHGGVRSTFHDRPPRTAQQRRGLFHSGPRPRAAHLILFAPGRFGFPKGRPAASPEPHLSVYHPTSTILQHPTPNQTRSTIEQPGRPVAPTTLITDTRVS